MTPQEIREQLGTWSEDNRYALVEIAAQLAEQTEIMREDHAQRQTLYTMMGETIGLFREIAKRFL